MSQAATEEVVRCPIPAEALDEATEEYFRHSEQLTELVNAYRDQGRNLRDLDGHPLLCEALRSIQRYRQTADEAQDALAETLERLSVAAGEAFAMADALKRVSPQAELPACRFEREVLRCRTGHDGPPPCSPCFTL